MALIHWAIGWLGAETSSNLWKWPLRRRLPCHSTMLCCAFEGLHRRDVRTAGCLAGGNIKPRHRTARCTKARFVPPAGLCRTANDRQMKVRLSNQTTNIHRGLPLYMIVYAYLVGGFNPSEKYESQLGWWIPIYGRKMFQITNRIYWLYCYSHY